MSADAREHTTFVNARIFTADPLRPHAHSIAFQGGVISAIDAAPRGEIIDLQGRFLGPAFIDSHLHLTLAAATLTQLDLSGCRSRDEFEARVAAHASAMTDDDAWLVAFGWNEADWCGEAPSREWLRCAASRPSVAWRMDQHACVLNDAALARIDCTAVDGGEIDLERGILREQAAWQRVVPVIPAPTLDCKRANLAKACAHLHALGIASVGSMEYLTDLRDVFVPARHSLSLRVHATVLDRAWPLASPPEIPEETSEFFRIIGLKSFADGTLGSRTALMLDPYSDAARDCINPCGIAVEHAARGELAAWMRVVQNLSLSPSVHAIGDRAARELLDSCDHAHDTPAPRLEHLQTLAREDIPRLAGRFASMQPLHKADDARLVTARLGASRLERFFCFRSLLAHGARLAFGSDWPIVSPDPLLGIKAAVTGLDLDGRVFASSENISMTDALLAYTRVPAEMLGFHSGFLREGRAADFVILDRSPFETDFTHDMPKVDTTIVAGRTVFTRDRTLCADR